MNARDGYDHAADYDGCSEPRGTDPKLRREWNILWFQYHGSWFQITNNRLLPEEVRQAWIQEEIQRDRQKNI